MFKFVKHADGSDGSGQLNWLRAVSEAQPVI